jgi:hypothetical protein
MRFITSVVLAFCCTAIAHAQEKKVVELNSVRLYLPDDLLKERLGSDVKPVAEYIKALEKEAAAFWAKTEQPKAKGLLIAVGVKPGKSARVWCDSIDGDIPAETLTKLEKKLGEVAAVDVKEGPIAFALEVKLWEQKPDKFPEMPKAWAEAAKKQKEPLMIPDGLFKHIWAD